MDVEETLARLNDFGPYQKRVLWITMLCFGFGAWVITLPVLIASNPVVHCTAEGVSNTTVDCNALMVNNRYCNLDRRFWDFASDEDTRTLVIRFQMYCGLDFKIGLVTTFFFAGYFVGSGIFGTLSDLHGRKKALMLSWILVAVFQFLSAFSTSYVMYIFLHTLSGVGIGGSSVAAYVLLLESVGNHYRSLSAVGLCAAFAVGMLLLAIVGSEVQNWTRLSVFTSIPFVLLIPALSYVTESPHWLFVRGDHGKLKNSLQIIARVNQTSQFLVDLPTTPVETRQAPPQSKLKDLLRYPVMRRRLFIMIFQWFISAFGYYGLSLNVGNLGNSLYTSMFLSGLAELPAYLPSIVWADTWGRRKTLRMLLWVATISYAICFALPLSVECQEVQNTCVTKTFRLIVSLVGKGAISAAFALNYIYGAELFPTTVRSRAIGVLNQAARIGSMLAPPTVVLLANYSQSLLFAVFGLLTITGAICVNWLEETLGEPLADTLEDTISAPEGKKAESSYLLL